MKTIIYILTIVLFASCNTTKAQKNVCPQGKYLVEMIDAKTKASKGKVLMKITEDDILYLLFANKRKPMPLAKMETVGRNKIDMEFNPFLADLSGVYRLKYLPQNHFELSSDDSQMLFFPFYEEEVAESNKAMNVEGKWYMKNDEEELTFDFKLPNRVHIQHKKDYEQTSGDVFWATQVNGEDITISATLFFNTFSGTFKQVERKQNQLLFTYKGKRYKMLKMNTDNLKSRKTIKRKSLSKNK